MNRGALLALAVLALAPGCRRRATDRTRDAASAVDAAPPWIAPVAVLDNVEIKLAGAADGAVVSRELGRQLARCLIESGDDVVALDRQVEPSRRAVHARLEVELSAEATADRAGAPHIVVAFAARLPWLDDDTLPIPNVQLVGESSILDGRADVAVLAVTEQLRGEVCRVLAAELDRLSADDLRPGLADADPDTVAWTLAVVAARRPPAILDAVIALLDRPPPVGDAAITALVALRDPRAVTALTDRIDLADRTRLTTLIEATIAIGGADAEDFLRVLTAHSDPTIARHARDGLTRLTRL